MTDTDHADLLGQLAYQAEHLRELRGRLLQIEQRLDALAGQVQGAPRRPPPPDVRGHGEPEPVTQ